jgi:hypothetical protein
LKRNTCKSAFALFGVIKPCCLLLWTLSFFGTTSGAVIAMMHYEKYLLFIPAYFLGYPVYRITRNTVRYARNPECADWNGLVLDSLVVGVLTSVSLLVFFKPDVMPWNMHH